MATVRKRKLPSGLVRWQASYVDGAGKRRAKLFDRKSDGEAWLTETRHDLVRGRSYPGQRLPHGQGGWNAVDQTLQRKTARAVDDRFL
jgi:integrase